MVAAAEWFELAALRERAREQNAEGVMLKRVDSAYGVGPSARGVVEVEDRSVHVDAVMIYAQAGHGRRASLYTDYTFAVWHDGELVPFAKAYSGLTDAEIREVDAWVRAHTLERFGPVRRVAPELVFELAFEGDAGFATPQERHCRPLPAHRALAPRQARQRGGHAGNASRAG